RWHKKSYDGSGKCDLFFTADDHHLVHGVLFEISGLEKPLLDAIEGLHQGYDEKTVEVVTASGVIQAVTYCATVIDDAVRPYEWYKRFVVEGAIEYGLPERYVQELQAIESIEDPDVQRALRETRIFEGRIIP
ncbi:MAG: gamma-glutamylcyclotransferase, partial [Nitrospirales bacterium]